MKQQIHDHNALLELLTEHEISRLPTLLSGILKKGSHPCKVTERLTAAIEGEYRPKGKFTEREMDLALVTLRLGGYRLLYTMSHAFGLPSLRTLMRKHVSLHIMVSLLGTDVDDMTENLREMVMRPRSADPEHPRGAHIMIDETALRQAAFEAPGHRLVLGGQCACRGLTEEDLQIRTGQDAVRIAEEMYEERAEDKPKSKYHYASQATTIAVSFFSPDDYRALPFSLSGTCGKKDSNAFVEQVAQIKQAWQESDCKSRYGPLWSIATDGDASRRKGGFEALLKEDLVKDTPLGHLLWPLHELGMNMKVGDGDGMTLDFDWKHVIKRMGTLIRSNEGMSINGTKVTSALLARYMQLADMASITMVALLEPHDPQNVIKAVELVKALKVLGTALASDSFGDTVSRRAIAGFADIFGAFVTAFTDSTQSLSEQLVLLSKCAHLCAFYYRKDTTDFMTSQLYFDTMTCIKNAFFTVAKQQVLNENEPLYLFQLGSDGVEKLFAGARMTGGHDSNFSLKELALRLGHGMDIMRVFADHPEWYLAHQRMSTTHG
jgi:hypothetical protein